MSEEARLMGALAQVLADCFEDAGELRRFVVRHSDGLDGVLPPPSVRVAELADAAARAIVMRGQCDVTLYDALVEACPYRASNIQMRLAAFGVTETPAVSDARAAMDRATPEDRPALVRNLKKAIEMAVKEKVAVGHRGDVLAGERGTWTLERFLGSGSTGSVWLARGSSGERVAVKLLSRKGSADERDIEAFKKAASHLVRIKVEGIIEIHETVRNLRLSRGQTAYFFVMEYHQGSVRLDAWAAVERRSWEEIADVVGRVAAVLTRLHQKQYSHNDIKPGNILVLTDGDVRLIDFDEAQGPDDISRSSAGDTFWRAPEARNHLGNTPLVDVYGLAATMAAVAHGRALDTRWREAPQFVQLCPWPDLVREVLQKALAAAERRTPSASTFATELKQSIRDRGPIRLRLDAIGVEFVWVSPMPPGPAPYRRGAHAEDAGFWIAVRPLTSEQLTRFLGKRAASRTAGPATALNYREAEEWCVRAQARLHNEFPTLTFRCDLPTVEQWALAAAGAGARAYPWGDDVSRAANLAAERVRGPSGPRLPDPQDRSEWGCEDLVTSVRQWCRVADASGIAPVRGGSWRSRHPDDFLISAAGSEPVEYFDDTIGFRPIVWEAG